MYGSFAKMLVIVGLLTVTIIFSVYPQQAPIKSEFSLEEVFGALGAIFVIVLLVERVTEIVNAIWRQPHADSIKTEIEALSKDAAKSAEVLERTKELTTYKAETKSISLLVGFSISIIVCAAGVGLLSTILDVSEACTGFIRGVDILLTSGLIAGGSDGFHKFVSALEAFFAESKKRIENKT